VIRDFNFGFFPKTDYRFEKINFYSIIEFALLSRYAAGYYVTCRAPRGVGLAMSSSAPYCLLVNFSASNCLMAMASCLAGRNAPPPAEAARKLSGVLGIEETTHVPLYPQVAGVARRFLSLHLSTDQASGCSMQPGSYTRIDRTYC